MGEELKLKNSLAVLQSHYLCVGQVFIPSLANNLI